MLPERETRAKIAQPAGAMDGAGGSGPGGGDAAAEIFALCQRLIDADPRTRIVFTTRESLPAPFDHRGRTGSSGARQDGCDRARQPGDGAGRNGTSDRDPGGTPQEIEDLVEAVGCHARALVLLAREVARRGVRATTADLRGLMAELERKHPGDRENSLYASVELSLRRLPAATRERVKVLGVCHGGVHFGSWGPDLEGMPCAGWRSNSSK